MPNYDRLPILNQKRDIVKCLNESTHSRCIVIRGETGSGKTTQVPLYILDDAVQNKRKCNIWVTQPRKIAARTIAQYLTKRSKLWQRNPSDQKSVLPNIVGYHVGLDKCVQKDTRITYMTPGIASRKVHSDRNLDSVTHLIIGEVYIE